MKRSTPAMRSVYVGAISVGRPLATYVIIGLCALVYVLQWLIPGDFIFQQLAFASAYAGSEP